MDHREVMLIILKFLLLFMVGTIVGWCLEVFWRKYFGLARRWINPGFLNGPWLPLYGFGTIVLYILSDLQMPLALRAIVFFLALTVLEYIAGFVFIKYFKIRLWDYSNSFGNIQGIVCPLYSILWTVLGFIFFYTLYPLLTKDISFLLDNLEFSFFVGLYSGVFTVDVWMSFNLATRLKTMVNETEEKWHVDYEKLKLELRDRLETDFKNRTKYLLPFNGEMGNSLKQQLAKHRARIDLGLKAKMSNKN